MTTTKALRRASTSTPPFAATSTFRPTRPFSTIKSSSIYYSSGTNPVEAREELEVSLKTHGMKTGNVMAVTGGSVLFVVLVVLLLVRKYRKRPVRDRKEPSKNAEEGIALQTFQQNDNDEYLRPNGTGEHLISNDAEQQATSPYSAQLPVQATSSEISIHGYVYME